MPKIFSEKQLLKVWQLVYHEKKTKNVVCRIMNCNTKTAELLFETARNRYGRPIDKFLNTPEEVVKVERPKAVYSNHSPMGVAS